MQDMMGMPIYVLEREFGSEEGTPQNAVNFSFMPVMNQEKSDKAGHPVYEDVEFFRGITPGSKNSECIARADERRKCAGGVERSYKERYPNAYKAFKDGSAKPMEGMPLEEWPQITRGQAMTLKAVHIHTVEALAEVHDGNLERLGFDGRELRNKARSYLAKARETASVTQHAAEKAELQQQLEDMRRQIAELSGKRGPGRPRKDEVHADGQ